MSIYKTAVETELREGVLFTDSCSNSNIFLQLSRPSFVSALSFGYVIQLGSAGVPSFGENDSPHFLFRIGTCEDKIKFCKYAADRQIHCGISTGHERAIIHHIKTICWYQLCDRLSTASSSSYIICVTAGPVTAITCHYMRRIHESWIAKDLEGVFRVVVDIVFWPLP